MSKQQNLKLGVILSYLWVVVHIATNFVFTPILLRFLGQSEYGLYQVVASFLAYINVLESSLSAGVLRFYCEVNARDNKEKIENVLASCRIIYNRLIVFMLFLGTGIVFAFRLFYRSSFTAAEINEGSMMLMLLIINICITMKNAIYLACIRGNERFAFEKAGSAVNEILKPVVCLLILFQFPYALTVTCVQVGLNVTLSVIYCFYAKSKLHIQVVLHERDRKLERKILVFASGILLANIADQIFWRTDQVILAKLYNTAIVAVYAIGAQIYTNYMYAGTMLSSVFFPKLSLYYQEEDGIEKMSALFIKVGRIAFLICFMVLSGFVIFGQEFLFLWAGREYIPAYEMALVVMIPFTVDVIQNLGLSILQVMNEYGFRAKIYFVAALLNIGLTIILAHYFAGFGAALSTGLTMLLTSGVILNLYYAKVIRLDMTAFWKNIVSILIRLLPLLVVGWGLNHIYGTVWTLGNFVIKGILYVVGYAVVAYLTVLNPYEKNMVNRILKRIVMIRSNSE